MQYQYSIEQLLIDIRFFIRKETSYENDYELFFICYSNLFGTYTYAWHRSWKHLDWNFAGNTFGYIQHYCKAGS